jgi:hypothetical protein
MKTILILMAAVCCILAADNACGQSLTEKSHSNLAGISTGNSVLARQDLIYSPFVHSDHSLLSLGLKYQREKNYYQYWNIHFSVNTSYPGVPFEMEMGDHHHKSYPHEFVFINTSYGIGIPVSHRFRSRDWIGVALKMDLQASFYSFILSDMFGYYIEHSLNGWYRHTYTFRDKHFLSGRLELPIAAWLARPPYLAEDDTFIENISSHNRTKILLAFIGDGKPVTWNTLQRVNLDIEYLYPVSKRLFLGVDYRFVFIHTNEPRTLLSYHHNIHVTSSFKF